MKKSKSKSFTFLYPTTYEENQEQLTRLNSEILEASKQRNYALAKKLQQEYNYCVQVDNYFKEQQSLEEKNNESTRLKNARLREEDLLRQRMTNKMRNILSQYEQRLQVLEKKHQDNLSNIEDRFSNPRYAAYRPSPSIHQMLKVESFYADHRDFDSAEQYRNMIAQKAQQEIIELESNHELSFTAAIDAENRRYEIEKKGFHERLENEKAKLKKETEKELLQIKNKYSNLALRNADLNKKPSNSPIKTSRSSPPIRPNKSSPSLASTTKPKVNLSKTISTSVIIDINTDSNSNTYNPYSSNTTKGDNKSVFVTNTNNSKPVGGEENVYKALNDGFSDILQRTEIQNKNGLYYPVGEPKTQPQLTTRSPKTIKKPYSRSPRTAKTRRRPTTNIMFSSTY